MVYFRGYLDLISSFYFVCQLKCSLASTGFVSVFVFSVSSFVSVRFPKHYSVSFLFCLFRIEFFFVSVFLNTVRSNSVIPSSPDLPFRMSLRDSISAPIDGPFVDVQILLCHIFQVSYLLIFEDQKSPYLHRFSFLTPFLLVQIQILYSSVKILHVNCSSSAFLPNFQSFSAVVFSVVALDPF